MHGPGQDHRLYEARVPAVEPASPAGWSLLCGPSPLRFPARHVYIWGVRNRTFAALILASSVAVSLAACGDDNDGGGGASYGDPCNQFTTCGTCTPQNGCGWCFDTTSGLCTSDPDNCSDVTVFTWTWDPSGCPDFDAAVAPVDAGKQDAPQGTPTSDASPDTGTSDALPDTAATDAPTDTAKGD